LASTTEEEEARAQMQKATKLILAVVVSKVYWSRKSSRLIWTLSSSHLHADFGAHLLCEMGCFASDFICLLSL
jgi:hypothetical protein